MIDKTTYIGFFVVPIGFILHGAGMCRGSTFGKGFGGVNLVLGMDGLVAAGLQLVDPASMIGSLSFFAYLIFYSISGWKVYGLSRIRWEFG